GFAQVARGATKSLFARLARNRKRRLGPLAMRRIFWLSISFALCASLFLHDQPSAGQEKLVFDTRILDVFQARNIGPANMGGRIVDLAVVDKNPDTNYVAAATGGVWKTT